MPQSLDKVLMRSNHIIVETQMIYKLRQFHSELRKTVHTQSFSIEEQVLVL